MKKLILILFFCSASSILLAQLADTTIKIKPISLHLNEPQIPFSLKYQQQHRIPFWKVKGNILVIQNHPYGDYTYNYLNPNNAQDPGQSLFIGFANYFLNNTINNK